MQGPLPTAIANPDAPGLEGQVEVAEGVALGDNVVLNADPGCRLVLAPGVCVGSGAIIQAVRGDLILEPGAVLGSGVLIVGSGRIGRNACIGAESTLINPAISSGQVVPPNSLLGDPSQPAENSAHSDSSALVQGTFVQETLAQGRFVQVTASLQENGKDVSSPAQPIPPNVLNSDRSRLDLSSTNPSNPEMAPTEDSATAPKPAQADGIVLPETHSDAMERASAAVNGTRPAPAHGQKQVQALLAKLFPHRQPLGVLDNGVTSGGVSPEDKP